MSSRDIISTRIEKFKKILELGVNPYLSFSIDKTFIAEILLKPMGEIVEVCGRLHGFRKH